MLQWEPHPVLFCLPCDAKWQTKLAMDHHTCVSWVLQWVLAFSQVSFQLLATSYVGKEKAGILFVSVGREKELIRMWQVSGLSDTAHVISLSLLGNGRSMRVKQDFMCIVQSVRTNGLIMGCLLLFRFWLTSTVRVRWSRSTEAHWLILTLDVSWWVFRLIFHSVRNLLHCCL